jgi:tetratricopeptide (TPR) repeat protein
MSRTARYKLAYVAVLAILALAASAAIIALGGGIATVIAVALLLLIPGRIQGFYYSDLFTGRRLLDTGEPEKAIPFIERFLESIKRHPQRSKLLWLSWSIYTPSVVAMAINNLGAARLGLGQVNEAEQAFTDALTQDPLYPLPHFNLAIVHELRGNRAGAAEAVERARQLGYSGGTLDTFIRKSQSLLASVEGRAARA